MLLILLLLLLLSLGNATELEYRDLLNELNIMANVGEHANVVSLIGACTTGGELTDHDNDSNNNNDINNNNNNNK